ncbi:chemotaxis protein CheA [Caldibacillus thermolactis]|jgi:two-component system, chemotaxis family, sensor kinase CheA|uniref:Chemotaxis protein CheA n=1 Tax=Pallidibacillus thermolactis TaxID=251051 RepID=A0ABT2WG76_9BACI|nr:chemotaxis protein CheA [Pallidibacillus thermolactis]MCU9593072.1 chemotaxis protein CheA [Pallidibacillus thermolactis]MCU9600738.1 chemotaxis protein CheA [Pallidibacillus thermolactis subsp. kokeshiiformis]
MGMNQYLEVFLDEGREHLQSINQNLLRLENNPNDMSIINEIFRSAHTLKGMSATMGFEDMANLTHQMENVLDGIRNGKLVFSSQLLDIIFGGIDHLENMIESIAEGGDGKEDVEEVIAKLKAIETGQALDSSIGEVAATVIEDKTDQSFGKEYKQIYDEFELTVLEQAQEQGFHTYEVTVIVRSDTLLKAARVYMVFDVLEKMGDVVKSSPSTEDLEEENFNDEFVVTLVTKDGQDDVKKKIMKVSEIDNVIVKNIDVQKIKQLKNTELDLNVKNKQNTDSKKVERTRQKQNLKKETKTNSKTNKTIRVNIERLDTLMNLFEELVIDRGRLDQIAKEVNHQELIETVEKMSRVTNDLQSVVLTMRMVPVETVFNRFPKMVRQLSRELNKKINLKIIGADTELDRTVIDEIGDPLVHLLRNSVDHGIESPEIRLKKGKSEEGTIELKAYHSGNYVFIEINDDGAGINREKVATKAVQKGFISEEEKATLSDNEIYNLILSSGFSTAEKVSDISGRGVGLDVVKSTIESLGGTVSVHSKENVGTQFIIQLPLTLSIISVMLVNVQEETYAIPLSSIIETAIIRESDIRYAHEQPVFDYRGNVVPLLYLDQIFDVPQVKEKDEYLSTIIIRKGDKLAGLIVDSFIGQEDIVLKSLGNYLTNVFAISGATILGDGKVALIVDCNALIK